MIKQRIDQANKIRPIVNLILELSHNAGAYSPTRYAHYLPKKQINHRQTTLIIQL